MNKTLLTIAGVTLCAVAAQAYTKEVYITGATAFRNNVQAALTTDFTCVQKDNSTISKANKRTWVNKNAVAGIAVGQVAVYESYTGSGAGIGALANGTSVSFLSDTGTALSHTADLALSDVKQASTDFTSPSLTGQPVGVVPFVIAKGTNVLSQSVTNVDHNLMKLMLANGGMVLGHINGDGADTTWINLVGRNNSSGTRITTHAETDYGIKTVSQLAKAVDGAGVVVGATNATSCGENYSLGWSPGSMAAPNTGVDAGYDSGSKVCNVLRYNPMPALGYSAVGDADVQLLAFAAWEGCQFPPLGAPVPIAVVCNGSYKFWAYENLYKAQTLESWVDVSFRPYLVSGIAASLDGRQGIPVGFMNVARDVDGGPVYPNYY